VSNSEFPERVYTVDEVKTARKLVEAGYKHTLTITGSASFQKQAHKALEYIKTAGFHDFLRTYIRQIVEINGVSQLRESEAAIWANTQLLENLVQAAGFFVQKAYQMQEFLAGKQYYGGAAEARSVEKRIAFLKALKKNTSNPDVRKECSAILKQWKESTFVF
jgi:hypothetical protein